MNREMAEHATTGVEEQRQVAISMCSAPTPSKLVAVESSSLQKLMLKSPPQADAHGDEQQGREVPLAKKVAAEFVGTFILMFAVVSTVVADAQHGGAEGLVGVAAAAGLAVVAVVLAVVQM